MNKTLNARAQGTTSWGQAAAAQSRGCVDAKMMRGTPHASRWGSEHENPARAPDWWTASLLGSMGASAYRWGDGEGGGGGGARGAVAGDDGAGGAAPAAAPPPRPPLDGGDAALAAAMQPPVRPSASTPWSKANENSRGRAASAPKKPSANAAAARSSSWLAQ